jgi:soluble lytic murein transglycosylase-like protein
MRYVTMVVAIGLLVVGSIAYAAQAALTRAGAEESHQPSASTKQFAARFVATATRRVGVSEMAYYHVRVQQIKIQQEQELLRQQQERQRQESVAQYGEWGPDLVEAAAMYGQDPAALYRVMICESKGDAYADNGVCKGLFQFNPSTWASTPYGGQSIYDGHAQVKAAAWMWSQGRKGEWTCG